MDSQDKNRDRTGVAERERTPGALKPKAGRFYSASSARRGLSVGATAAVLMLALVACAGGGTSANMPSGSASDGATDPASDETTGSGLGDEPCDFTFSALTGLDASQVADYAAVDAMREAGCTIKVETLLQSDLVAQGVVQNRYQIVLTGSTSFFILAQQGEPVVMLAERSGNDWAMLGETGLKDCHDVMDAKSLGVPGLSSVGGAVASYWFNQECADLEAPFVAVPGGPQRAQALLSGQIATSVLPMADALTLLREAPDKIELMANFAETVPQLITYATWSNSKWVEENPNTVKLFMRLKLEEHRKIAGDPEYLIELMDRYKADVAPEDVEKVAEFVATSQIFDPNGGVAPEDVAFTIDLFQAGGAIDPEPKIDPDGIVARDLLDEVLDEIGRE